MEPWSTIWRRWPRLKFLTSHEWSWPSPTLIKTNQNLTFSAWYLKRTKQCVKISEIEIERYKSYKKLKTNFKNSENLEFHESFKSSLTDLQSHYDNAIVSLYGPYTSLSEVKLIRLSLKRHFIENKIWLNFLVKLIKS